MPVITLPDGSQRSFDQPITVAELAANIGAGLAKAALAGRVDGKLVDTSFVIDRPGSDPGSILRSAALRNDPLVIQFGYDQAALTQCPARPGAPRAYRPPRTACR